MQIKNLMSKIENQKGTTVVELLVYLALLSIFLLVLLDIFTTTLDFKLQTESSSALNQDARYILAKLSYDLYNSDGITVPATLGSTSGTLQISSGGTANTYALDSDNNLIVTRGGVSTKMNGLDTKILNISFKRLGTPGEKPTIQVLFTIESKIEIKGGSKTQDIQTTLGLR